MSRLDQEKDPKILHQVIELLENHNRALTEQIKKLLEELAAAKGDSTFQQMQLMKLERQLAKMTKLVFGKSSEQRTTDGGKAEGGEDKDKKKKPGHGPTKQPKLPVVEVVHALDEADKVCPACGGGLHEMKGQDEESTEIDVLPLRFVIKHHKRKKYARAAAVAASRPRSGRTSSRRAGATRWTSRSTWPSASTQTTCPWSGRCA